MSTLRTTLAIVVALEEAIDDPRVDVGGAAHRGCIAQVLRDLLHHAGHRTAPGRDALSISALAKQRRGQHGRLPRAEVLRREIVAGRLLEVGIDVARPDVVPASILFIGQEFVVPVPAFLERSRTTRDRRASSIICTRRFPLFAVKSNVIREPSTFTCPRRIVARPNVPLSRA